MLIAKLEMTWNTVILEDGEQEGAQFQSRGQLTSISFSFGPKWRAGKGN